MIQKSKTVIAEMAPYSRLGVVLLCALLAGCVESNNRAPEISALPDVIFEAGIPNFIEIGAVDPDGDPLEFRVRLEPTPVSVEADPSTAPQIESVTQGAILTWLPSLEDGEDPPGKVYVATVFAEDGRGGKAGRALRITVVKPEAMHNDALRFARPVHPGVFSETPCIESVSIKAVGVNDAESVVLGVETVALEAPCSDPDREDCPRVTPDEIKAAEGGLRWCPTSELLDGRPHQDLILIAEAPGTDLSARQPFFVRFDWPVDPGCQTQAPGIEHLPNAPGLDIDSPQIEAEFTRVADLKTPPVLAYAVRPVGEQSMPTQWNAVTFGLDEADRWVATPYIAESNAESAAREIVYRIVVTASQASADVPCSVTGKSDVFVVPVLEQAVSRTQVGQCGECDGDNECAGDGSLCIPIEGQGFCMMTCETIDDCEDGASCVQAESLGGTRGSQCVPSDLNCGQLCQADRLEGEYGNESREDAHRVEIGEHDGLTVCDGESDWYQVPVSEGVSLRVQVAFDANAGDLDLRVHPPGVGEEPTDSTSGQRDEEFVEIPCVRRQGQAFIKVWGHAQAENTYKLTVETAPGRCEIECTVDDYEAVEEDARWRGAPVELPWEPGILTLCQGDIDRYFFTTEAPMRITAEMVYSSVVGAITMKAFRGEAMIQEASPPEGQSARISWNSDANATYVLEVAGASPDTVGRYDLNVHADARPQVIGPCDDDSCLGLPCVEDRECGENAACAPRIGLEVDEGESGICARRCQGDDVCQNGYACKNLGPARQACLPSGAQGPGAGCGGHWECANGQACLEGPGGYCAQLGCRRGMCADDTVCAPWGERLACHLECMADGDCRGARGYVCRRDREQQRRYCSPEAD